MSGAAMQGLLRNPLAEPGVVGISSAAAFGSVLAFYSGLSASLSLALPLGGIAGAILATFLLFVLLGRGAGTATLTFVKTGSSVKQGQVIGYIGTTGLSTGPHLHYEFQVNGVHVDPLSQKVPMADPIARSERQRFLQQSQPLIARMDQEKATLLAANKR